MPDKKDNTSVNGGKLTLQQKFIELRKAIPKITKEKYSDDVKYKFAKIDDVWQAITPVMNEIGVNFCIVRESNATTETITVKTKYGERLMFIYNSDILIKWTNSDDPSDEVEADIHTVGWNDDPAKAKGCAHTYALKYYLFEKFSVDMSEDDPDSKDNSATGKGEAKPKQDTKAKPQSSPSPTKKAEDTAHQVANALIHKFGKDQAGDMLFPITGYKTTKEIPNEKLSEVLDLIDKFIAIA